MIPSIRTFLLINLLLGITVIFSFAIIGNIFIEHRTLYRHLDAELASTALVVQGVFDNDIGKDALMKVQNRVQQIPTLLGQMYCAEYAECRHFRSHAQQVQFQIWNKKHKLILQSNPAIAKIKPAKKQHGFYRTVIDNEEWRYFVAKNPETGFTVVTAEQHFFRDSMREEMTQNSILILLVTYPFLALLIWVIVGRGLDSIRQVTGEVHKRAASNLQAVNIETVPPEIKPLVDELNKLFARLHATFHREKRFASDAAHELRTPLAALRAQAQVALSLSDDSERKTVLFKVIKGVDRSTHIVQQLLTLSRMVPETVPKEVEPVNLNKEASEVVADLVPTAMKKNIEIELLAPNGKQQILGKPTAINILLRNLVDNAIRYTPEGGLVQIVVNNDEKHIVLKVIDNGKGIPEKLRKRVFERFYRVVGNKATGSGLGLSIVKQVVDLHNGKIELNVPKTGVGLEVRVLFKKES